MIGGVTSRMVVPLNGLLLGVIQIIVVVNIG